MEFKLVERERVFTTHGAFIAGVDLAPLLVHVGAPIAAVFNVNWFTPDGVPEAGEMAAEIGVEAEVHKLVDGQELLVMASADLPAFFDGWRQFGPWEVDVLDLPAPPTAAEMDDAVAAVERPPPQRGRLRSRRQERGLAGPVLSSLASPTFYYHGHEDACVRLESRTDRLSRLVLGRCIALEAGKAWRRQRVTVLDPGDDVVARLLDDSHEWMGEISERSPESVSIALSPSTWRDRRRSSGKPSYVAVFDIPSQEWELRRVVR